MNGWIVVAALSPFCIALGWAIGTALRWILGLDEVPPVSAGAYARKAAAFVPTPLWVTAGLRFGEDDERDALALATWVNTVGDEHLVYVLGGLGDPDYLDGLPGRVHLLAGPGDPMSTHDLPPDLAHRKQPHGALDATERRRIELCEEWTARAGLAFLWTGYGPRYDAHKSMLRPEVNDRLVIRGRVLLSAPNTGTWTPEMVLPRRVAFDPDAPTLYRLEDV